MASSSSTSSSDSSVVSSEEGDAFFTKSQPLGIKPYMYEPRPSATSQASDEAEEDPDPYADRVGKNDWCTCGRCQAQDDSDNSFCCRECPELDTIRKEVEALECVTAHTGVQSVSTNVHVLRAAYNANRTKYGQRRGRQRGQAWTENTKFRHVAYGNIVALAWGWLGRSNRVPLPACVMRMIREAFPSDTGYRGYREADESESESD